MGHRGESPAPSASGQGDGSLGLHSLDAVAALPVVSIACCALGNKNRSMVWAAGAAWRVRRELFAPGRIPGRQS